MMHNTSIKIAILIFSFTFWNAYSFESKKSETIDADKNLSKTLMYIKLLSHGLENYAKDHLQNYPAPPDPVTPQKLFPFVISIAPKAWPIGKNRHAIWLKEDYPKYFGKKVEVTDAWGHPLLCDTTPDLKHYTIVGLGRDGKFDKVFAGDFWDQRNLDNDIYFTGGLSMPTGYFISAPEGAVH